MHLRANNNLDMVLQQITSFPFSFESLNHLDSKPNEDQDTGSLSMRLLSAFLPRGASRAARRAELKDA